VNRPVTIISLVQSLGVHLAEVDHVDVRLVDREDVPLTWICSQRQRTIDTGHRDPITGLDCVHEVVVGKHYDSVGRLTRRHVLYTIDIYREQIYTHNIDWIASTRSLWANIMIVWGV